MEQLSKTIRLNQLLILKWRMHDGTAISRHEQLSVVNMMKVSRQIIRQSYVAACSIFRKPAETLHLSHDVQKAALAKTKHPAPSATRMHFLSEKDIKKTEEVLKEASCSHNPF